MLFRVFGLFRRMAIDLARVSDRPEIRVQSYSPFHATFFKVFEKDLRLTDLRCVCSEIASNLLSVNKCMKSAKHSGPWLILKIGGI